MKQEALTLMLISQPMQTPYQPYLRLLLELVENGVSSVQIRDKKTPVSSLKFFITAIQEALLPYQTPILLNDHVLLAKEMGIDGVHLGQNDMSPEKARTILGKNAIIGYSVETKAHLEKANTMNCIDYIAASAVFQSPTKKDCQNHWGMSGLHFLIQQSKHPVIAIGGIMLSHIAVMKQIGVRYIAVSSALHDAPIPALSARQFSHALKMETE